MTRTLLIDGDVVAYQCASSVEKAIEWEPGYWTWHCDEDEVKAKIEQTIETYVEKLEADVAEIALTDSDGNYRKDVLPTYKGNRKSVKKPLVLMSIREWLIEEHGARLKPKLEGDDVMGILSTWRKMKGEKIIVSIDKDMKTIPGLYCRDLTLGVVEITEQEADYWHLYQTLIGDTTDGYKGCPGVGPKKAVDLIGTAEEPLYSSVQEAWETIVVPAYEKAKLTEADALQQARVARILRASDYDFKNQQPILWNPRGTGRLPTKETNADRNV